MVFRIVTIDLDGVGWKSYFQIKRGTTRVSVKKDVAVGLALRKGQPAFGYLGKDLNSNRPVVIFYADGKERDSDKMIEIEYVKEKEVDIYELEIQKAFNETDKVFRVRIKTNEGNISYKPSRYVDEFRDVCGFKTKQRKQEMLTVEELPKKLWEINERLGENAGLCKVKISYFLWNKEIDGKIMPIRFLKEKQIGQTEFLETEESVK